MNDEALGRKQTDSCSSNFILNVDDAQFISNELEESGQNDLFNQSFFNENSAILTMLPTLLQDLFYYKSNLDVLLGYLDSQILSVSDEMTKNKCSELKSQISALCKDEKIHGEDKISLIIDEDKSLLLSLMFGKKYIGALKILERKENIKIVITGSRTQNIQEIGEYYLNNLKLPINDFENVLQIRVLQSKYMSKSTKLLKKSCKKNLETLKHKLIYLQIKSLLEKIGLTLNSDGNISRSLKDIDLNETLQEIEMVNDQINAHHVIITEEFSVDLNNWYCSCNDYQSCYEIQDEEQFSACDDEEKIVTPAVVIQVEQLIAKYTTSDTSNSLIAKLFQSSSTNCLDPIPICPHLIALLILLYNKEVNPKYLITLHDCYN